MYPAQSSADPGGRRSSNFSDKTLPRPRKFVLRGFLSKLWGPPLYIICGQLMLQLATWGFFAYILSRRFLPLRDTATLDDWYKPLTWLCTQISAGLASLSCFLFALGVQQSIAFQLHGEGMPMPRLIVSLQIARRSFIGDLKNLKLVALSFAVMIATGAQTAGWSNLITPQFLNIKSSITGRELDLSSPLLQSTLPESTREFCVYNTSNLPALTVGQTESGFAAGNENQGFPTSVILLGQSFLTSTGGILPLTFVDVPLDSWFPDPTTLPAALSISGDLPSGLSSDYSITQQGYTADVSCTFQNLTRDSTPSLQVETKPLEDEDGNDSLLSNIIMSSDCNGPTFPDGSPFNSQSVDTIPGDGSGSILMIACGGSGGSYTLIFSGADLYSFIETMVCTLAPKTTKVRVDYSYDDSPNSTFIETLTHSGGSPDLGGPAGLSAVTTIYNMMYFSQGQQSNIVGDQLQSLILNGNLGDAASILPVMVGGIRDGNALLTVLKENYIRGVTEYSGSVFRACLSATGQDAPFLATGLPPNPDHPDERG
ncbi:hypothetical protein MVEN_00490300 [Mycena venus]|uniref:Uncharacterized protein n=1 Tax=Mycena venus TaxID=2733690 RepID=A0A8H6YVT4_9AGAR|nr:hypothetical protein MVEN_00490300 [Mycena venus]